MGWSWRKSIDLGAFRINFGKHGIGFTTGSTGFRTGVRSDGRKYTSVTIPGTGIRYQGSKASSGLGLLAMLFGELLSDNNTPPAEPAPNRLQQAARTWQVREAVTRLRKAQATEEAKRLTLDSLEELEQEASRRGR